MGEWASFYNTSEIFKFGFVSYTRILYEPNCIGVYLYDGYLYARTFTRSNIPIIPTSKVTDDVFKAIAVAIGMVIFADVYIVINIDKLLSDPKKYIQNLFNTLTPQSQQKVLESVENINDFVVNEDEED